MHNHLTIIGAGLAGCEAALFASAQGFEVTLFEMKPGQFSPAHDSPLLSELVCSNSFRASGFDSAVGLLKLEMSLLGSSFMEAALSTRVPAGKALAVDREAFSRRLTSLVHDSSHITLVEKRIDSLPETGPVILSGGPLMADELASDLFRIAGADSLHFYDAIAPIVTTGSIDMDHAFWADRWDEEGKGDYLNCPMTEEEYNAFYQALTSADQVPLHSFEKPKFFEGCLPVEVMAARGRQTLLFGPMKPVGLVDPHTGERPFSVIQLRKENPAGTLLNMVGFQTKLTHPSQLEVFRMVPALSKAEFARLGSIHRNTFLEAPKTLDPLLRLKNAPHIMVAGQLSGVEGYVESAASGLLAGLFYTRLLKGLPTPPPPESTAMGGLLSHLSNTQTKHFQPSNINFGLLPPLPKKPRVAKRERGRIKARRALVDFLAWIKELHMEPAHEVPDI